MWFCLLEDMPNIQDNDGAVALHYAVAHADLQLCKSLITSTTVQATDTRGVHPLLIAGQRSTVQVELFISRN